MVHRVVKAYLRILVRGILINHRPGTPLTLPPPGRTNGFTLLELLVVVVIVSILFSFLTLSIRSNSPEDLIKEEAHRLNRLLQLALEEAVLRNTEYGLQFNLHGYQFLQLNENNWQIVDTDKLLRKRELPLEMEIELAVEQIDIIIADVSENSDNDFGTKEKIKPQIFLMSSEEIIPEFSARFTIPGVETSYVVKATLYGKHTVSISDF